MSKKTWLMIGLDGAGKTTLLYQLKGLNELTPPPTIGFNVETIILKHHHITIWDLSGHPKYRPLWKHYCQIDGLIFVIDATDELRFEEASEELHSIVKHLSVPILILANKSNGSVSLDYLIEKLQLYTLYNKRWAIFDSSIDNWIEWLL